MDPEGFNTSRPALSPGGYRTPTRCSRFPLLRHHGITHSIFGVTVIAGVGTFVVPIVLAHVVGPAFAAGSPLLYFLAMEGGGLSHVFLDGFTHYSVPPLAPFSEWEFHLDADRAINLGTLAFTGFSFWLMLYERGRVPVSVWEATAWLLLVGYGGYLAIRGVGRWRAGRVRVRGGYSAVVPQSNPLVFLLVEERTEGGRMKLRFAEWHLFGGERGPARSLDVAKSAPPPGPVADARDALERSYAPAISHGGILAMTYHFAEVREALDHFTIFWYSLEVTMLGRAAGVIARVDRATGGVQTKSAWIAPRRLVA
ncbi:MAG: metal-dependent hydrolase [Thermoplasmata archaeon]|nr:metal-dependent hydrolase [Thermoplasmata archaeon]